MLWYAAMVAVLPILLWARWRAYWKLGVRSLWLPKPRAWIVIMGSSLATYLHQSINFYIMLCLLGAAFVMAYPMTKWQRFLGWTFLAMAGFNVGYLLGEITGVQNSYSVATRLDGLASWQFALSWTMVATLISWGGYDDRRHYRLLLGLRDDHLAGTLESEA